MLAASAFHQQFSKPHPLQIHGHLSFNNPILLSKTRRSSVAVRRCGRRGDNVGESGNYYELLGVSVDATSQEIKDAYRKLQKIYHPDIAGEKGHESTLMLNKAYEVLMRDEIRKEYDASIGKVGVGIGREALGSVWRGPLRPQALFVDENACVGCRECVNHAPNTFTMDEAFGTARVKFQYGDDDEKIEISVESCPVNCIHLVDTQDLAVLEHLIQPQPKVGYGIYGQGWERPTNVFLAAEAFNKQKKRQEENQQKYGNKEETPAQAEARESAYRELRRGSFGRIWNWLKKSTGQ